jgi:hypothetical protein
MKRRKWLSAAGSVCLLLAALPARADTLPYPAASARGVYLNGLVYRALRTGGTTISNQQGGVIYMQIGVPIDKLNPYTTVSRVLTAPPSDSGVPSQVNSTYHVCQYPNRLYGNSMAVFNGRIYYGYSANDCGLEYSHAYVATFDPVTNTWVGNRYMGPWSADSGAALAVFGGQIWLFTDGGTWSSADPESGWTWHAARVNNRAYKPLDAITINPPGAISPARVLIVYGVGYSTSYFTQLAYAVWTGNLDANYLSPVYFTTTGYWSGQVSLQNGTAFNKPGTAINTNGQAATYSSDLTGPKVQLLALQLPATNVLDRGTVVHYEFAYNAANNVFSASWTQDPSTFGPSPANPSLRAADLFTYPWYAPRCNSVNPAAQGLNQIITVNYLLMQNATSGLSSGFGYDSDFLVPQNKNAAANDIPITSCAETGGHNNITSAIANVNIAKSYWSLMGVVIGPPPFSVNGLTGDSVKEISNVDFGQTSGNAIKHTQEWDKSFLLSAGLEVSAGFFGVGVTNSFDVTYQHGENEMHESESATAIGYKTKLGTNSNFGTSAPGSIGWGIFTKPNIRVQDYAVYGHNYNISTGAGGYLNQDLTTMSKVNNSTTVEAHHFNLKDPSRGEIAGLFTGCVRED